MSVTYKAFEQKCDGCRRLGAVPLMHQICNNSSQITPYRSALISRFEAWKRIYYKHGTIRFNSFIRISVFADSFQKSGISVLGVCVVYGDRESGNDLEIISLQISSKYNFSGSTEL